MVGYNLVSLEYTPVMRASIRGMQVYNQETQGSIPVMLGYTLMMQSRNNQGMLVCIQVTKASNRVTTREYNQGMQRNIQGMLGYNRVIRVSILVMLGYIPVIHDSSQLRMWVLGASTQESLVVCNPPLL